MTTDKIFLERFLPRFCLVIYAVLATLGAFTGGMWAGLGIGTALVMFLTVWRIDGRFPCPSKDYLILILALIVAITLLNIHSTQPELSWHGLEKLITILLPLSLFTSSTIQHRAASKALIKLLPILAAVSFCVLGIELILNGPLLKMVKGQGALIYQYDRGLSYAVLLAFPIMAMIWTSKYRWLILLFIVILFIPTSYTESRASRLAFILGLLTTAAAFLLPKLTRCGLMVVPFLAAFWPFFVQKLFLLHHDWIERLPLSWQHRMEIWDYLSYRIFERPLLGWGLGSTYKLPFAEPHSSLYHFVLAPAPHPHNVVIQLWVELGVPGLAFGILFGLLVLCKVGRLDRLLLPFALGAWIAAFCLAMISYNFWSDSLWATFALTGFAFALQQKPASTKA